MDATVSLKPLNPPNSTNWKVSHGWFGSGEKPEDYPKVKFGRNSGAQVITFNIKDGDVPNVTFASNDPIWVQMDSKPGNQKPPVGADQNQIGAWKIMNDGKQLVVLDWNTVAGDLHYKLNFNGHGSLDPVIENGGGVKPPFTKFLHEHADVIGVALVALLLGMLMHRMFFAPRNRQTPAPPG